MSDEIFIIKLIGVRVYVHTHVLYGVKGWTVMVLFVPSKHPLFLFFC